MLRNLGLNHDPAASTAALPHVEEEAKVRRLHCSRHVAILEEGNIFRHKSPYGPMFSLNLENNVGRLATQLKSHPLQIVSCTTLDDLADLEKLSNRVFDSMIKA